MLFLLFLLATAPTEEPGLTTDANSGVHQSTVVTESAAVATIEEVNTFQNAVKVHLLTH